MKLIAFNHEPKHFPYGYSKFLAEEVVAEVIAKGQDVVICNPVIILGPGDLNMISGSMLIQTQRYGRWTPITSGGVSVIDVRDVARGHLAAAEKGRTGERYILATKNYSNREWFGMIAKVIGVSSPMIRLPNWSLTPIARIINGLRRLGISTTVDADQVRLGKHSDLF